MHNLQTLKSMLLTLPPEALIDAVLEDNKGSAFSPLLKDDKYIEQFTPFLENAARGAGDLDKLFCAVIQRDEVSPRALRHLAGYSSGGSDGREDRHQNPSGRRPTLMTGLKCPWIPWCPTIPTRPMT